MDNEKKINWIPMLVIAVIVVLFFALSGATYIMQKLSLRNPKYTQPVGSYDEIDESTLPVLTGPIAVIDDKIYVCDPLNEDIMVLSKDMKEIGHLDLPAESINTDGKYLYYLECVSSRLSIVYRVKPDGTQKAKIALYGDGEADHTFFPINGYFYYTSSHRKGDKTVCEVKRIDMNNKNKEEIIQQGNGFAMFRHGSHIDYVDFLGRSYNAETGESEGNWTKIQKNWPGLYSEADSEHAIKYLKNYAGELVYTFEKGAEIQNNYTYIQGTADDYWYGAIYRKGINFYEAYIYQISTGKLIQLY